MNSTLAPIVMFVYNRPKHTLLSLQSLQQNNLANKSTLYIYADGKKSTATQNEILEIQKTREIIKSQLWCKEVIIVESDENKGLATSVITGVTEIVNKHGKIIVLEDDLLLSHNFLKYMNECLDTYSSIENIYSVNGYMFPLITDESTTFLLPYTSTWAWGTWKNKWEAFNPNIKESDIEIIKSNPILKSRFNLSDYHYTNMLNYGNNSWGIKWYYSVFIKNGLNVFPTLTLAKNIGFDGSGVNCKEETKKTKTFFNNSNTVKIKIENQLNLVYLSKYLSLFTAKKNNISKKIVNKLFKK